MKSIRVLLVDDHPTMVTTLRKLLQKDFEVVGSTGDARTIIEMVRELNPDVVLLDLNLPFLGGFDTARQLRKKAPKIAIVFLTTHEDCALAAEALRIGAAGYVLKKSAASELHRAIRGTVKGRTFVSASVGLLWTKTG